MKHFSLSGRMRPERWRGMPESGIGQLGHADGPEIVPHLGPNFFPHLRRVRHMVCGQELACLEINLPLAIHIKPVADPCQTFLAHSLRSESYMAVPRGIIYYMKGWHGATGRIEGFRA